MDRHSAGFMYLKNKFPRISDAKIKEGVFVGLQIRELKQNVKAEDSLREVEKAARNHKKNVTTNFFGNYKAENCAIWWLILYNPTKLRSAKCL